MEPPPEQGLSPDLFAPELVSEALGLAAVRHPDPLDRVRALRDLRAEINRTIKDLDPRAAAEGRRRGWRPAAIAAAMGVSVTHLGKLPPPPHA